MTLIRSVGAVLGGFVVMAIAVMAGTIALTAALIPGGMKSMGAPEPGSSVPSGYLTANLILSFLAAVLGGLVTASIAASRPLNHALALAAFVAVMGIFSAKQSRGSRNYTGQPLWYPWVISAIGVAGVVAGGMIHG